MYKRKNWPKCDGVKIRNRLFSQSDLVLIRKLIRNNPSWGRTRLSEEVCLRLNWVQQNGRLKDRACRVALLKLEAAGYLRLPKKKVENGGKPPKLTLIKFPTERDLITNMPHNLKVEPTTNSKQSRLWNDLIANHHYLGLSTPVGRLLRYLVFGDEEIIACISFSEAAWKVRSRDQVMVDLGFDTTSSLNTIISNNRYLILPHVRVPNLASRILSLSLSRAIEDWGSRFGRKPQLVETFVDPSRYYGTCYLASNWIPIGATKGYAKKGQSHVAHLQPKILFMRATNKSLQKSLERHRLEIGSLNLETRSSQNIPSRRNQRKAA